VEGLADGVGQVLNIGDQIVVLGNGQGYAGDVDLLEGVSADVGRCHLSGDTDDGGGIEHSGSNAGNHVGRAGATGGYRDTNLAGRSGVAIRHVCGALFVAGEHMVDLRVFGHGIVRGQNGPARIAEYHVYALPQQTFPNDFSAFEFHGALLFSDGQAYTVNREKRLRCWRCSRVSHSGVASGFRSAAQTAAGLAAGQRSHGRKAQG